MLCEDAERKDVRQQVFLTVHVRTELIVVEVGVCKAGARRASSRLRKGVNALLLRIARARERWRCMERQENVRCATTCPGTLGAPTRPAIAQDAIAYHDA